MTVFTDTPASVLDLGSLATMRFPRLIRALATFVGDVDDGIESVVLYRDFGVATIDPVAPPAINAVGGPLAAIRTAVSRRHCR